jgi:hypothetical protein
MRSLDDTPRNPLLKPLVTRVIGAGDPGHNPFEGRATYPKQ